MMDAASPCISVCRMDDATGWCIGCSRTLEEIATWRELDETAKARVLIALSLRRERQTASPFTEAER